eukprot:2409043-Pyramimonas_sp.AAC.1
MGALWLSECGQGKKKPPGLCSFPYKRPSAAMLFSALAAPWVDLKIVRADVRERDVHSSQTNFLTGSDSADGAANLGLRLHTRPTDHERECVLWQ